MTQLSFDTQQSSSLISGQIVFDSKVFSLTEVYDRTTNLSVTAHQCIVNHTDSVRLVLNFIKNDTFVEENHVYFDTVHAADLYIREKGIPSSYDSAVFTGVLIINCYINSRSNIAISNIHKNLKTILINFYVNGDILRKVPQDANVSYDWLKYNPSVGMYSFAIPFVVISETDYNNVPTCHYRTTVGGINASSDYQYANKSISSVCSNSTLNAQKDNTGSVFMCPFVSLDHVLGCGYYEPDKTKIATLQLKSKNSSQDDFVFEEINVYLMRELQDESYSLVFTKDNLKNNTSQIIKKLSYYSLSFDNDGRKEELIKEAYDNMSIILMDYSYDYVGSLVKHVEHSSDLKKVRPTETKISYISTLLK